MSRSSIASAVAVIAAALLVGCGGGSGSGDAAKIQSVVAAYFHAITHHYASTACRAETPGYWNATRDQADVRLKAVGRAPLPPDCRAGLEKLFALNGASAPSVKVGVTAITLHGASATATLTSEGRHEPAKFVRADSGQWQISCCTGAQLAQQPTATFANPSGGMLPTLKIGRQVTVDNTALKSAAPQ